MKVMSSTDPDYARQLAQNLADMLTAYEEELMAIEASAPGIGQLRRAVGIAIAEAQYWISDQSPVLEGWSSFGDGRTHPANP